MKASVIVPTCARPVELRRTLESLRRAESGAVEIVVVDNNSDDELSEAVRGQCQAVSTPVRYVREPSPGLGAARHCGAREAAGEILVFLDDDVEVSDTWLDALLQPFQQSGVGIAGGPSIPRFAASVPAWFWDFIIPTPYGGWACGWLSLLDVGRSVDVIDPDWIWGLNFAIRRSLFEQLGGMHPDVVPAALQRWQGDGETGLTRKAKAAGVKATYVQEALVYHFVGPERLTPDYFSRRAYYQGVCDSFSAIRAGAAPSPDAPVPPTAPALSVGLVGWAVDAQAIKTQTVLAYARGWQFHQREAALDSALLRWIRRPHYLDADIRREVALSRTNHQGPPPVQAAFGSAGQ